MIHRASKSFALRSANDPSILPVMRYAHIVLTNEPANRQDVGGALESIRLDKDPKFGNMKRNLFIDVDFAICCLQSQQSTFSYFVDFLFRQFVFGNDVHGRPTIDKELSVCCCIIDIVDNGIVVSGVWLWYGGGDVGHDFLLLVQAQNGGAGVP